MTILSYQSIKDLCRQGKLISPYIEKTVINGRTGGLSEAGYDVHIRQTIVLYPNSIKNMIWNSLFSSSMRRSSFKLASTKESFVIPNDIMGKVADKSTWARQGLAVQNTILEPGWVADSLTLELSNHGEDVLYIEEGTPIAQIIFHKLDYPTDRQYNGKYMHQGKDPVSAILE